MEWPNLWVWLSKADFESAIKNMLSISQRKFDILNIYDKQWFISQISNAIKDTPAFDLALLNIRDDISNNIMYAIASESDSPANDRWWTTVMYKIKLIKLLEEEIYSNIKAIWSY